MNSHVKLNFINLNDMRVIVSMGLLLMSVKLEM